MTQKKFWGGMRVVLVAMLVAVLGASAGLDVASAATRPVTAGSSPGNPPGGGTKVLGEHFDGFCVTNFAPNSTVKVVNQLTGASTVIHTNAKGSGCANVPLKRACAAVPQRIVATGIGNDGKPATVSATVRAPATASLCAASSLSKPSSSSSGGTLPFTGSDILIPLIIGLVLIAVGATTVRIRRRRNASLAS